MFCCLGGTKDGYLILDTKDGVAENYTESCLCDLLRRKVVDEIVGLSFGVHKDRLQLIDFLNDVDCSEARVKCHTFAGYCFASLICPAVNDSYYMLVRIFNERKMVYSGKLGHRVAGSSPEIQFSLSGADQRVLGIDFSYFDPRYQLADRRGATCTCKYSIEAREENGTVKLGIKSSRKFFPEEGYDI